MNWKRRISMVAITTAITTAMVVGPVSASPMPPEFGSAVKCKYTVTEFTDGIWTEAQLRMIAVFPPVMYATENGNQVGWRFIVTRSTENGPYVVTNKSKIQKRVGVTSDSADFETRLARIDLPIVSDPDLVRFRVTIVMFHYNSDGSVHSKTTQLLSHHLTTFNGVKDWQGLNYCEGTAKQSVD